VNKKGGKIMNWKEQFKNLDSLRQEAERRAYGEALWYVKAIEKVSSRVENVCEEFAQSTGFKLVKWSNWRYDLKVNLPSEIQLSNCYQLMHSTALFRVGGYGRQITIDIEIKPPSIKIFLYDPITKCSEIPIDAFTEEQLAKLLKNYFKIISSDSRVEYYL
jgi:hypothetical protein